MLRKIEFCANHARRIKRFNSLSFEPGANLLIGPNGTGKSTIINAIAECGHCKRTEEGETDYIAFESELMNPRHQSGPAGNYDNMVLRSRANFSSHGEILQDLFKTLRIQTSTCLLLDEPESGQDFDHILILRDSIHKAADIGAQIICSTHHILFWERTNTVELEQGYQKRVTNEFCRIKCSDGDI